MLDNLFKGLFDTALTDVIGVTDFLLCLGFSLLLGLLMAFRLTYHIVLRDPAGDKEMIDKLRCRNGNLEIIVSRQETASAEL